MQPDVTPFFTIATTSSGLPTIAIRFWKEHCASGYEPSFGRSARNWGYRSSRAFCPRSMSTCSSRYHRISRSATSFDVSKGARPIAFRWSSQNFANVTGVAFWARGYFYTTSGNITDEAILQYLKYHEPTGVSRLLFSWLVVFWEKW